MKMNKFKLMKMKGIRKIYDFDDEKLRNEKIDEDEQF